MLENGDDTIENVGEVDQTVAVNFSDNEGQESSDSNTAMDQVNPETQTQVEPAIEEPVEKVFTQSELDRIIRDRLEREKAQFENNPALSLIKRHAEKNGLSIDQYVTAVEQQEKEEQALALAQQANIPPHVARHLQELQQDKERALLEQQKQQQKQQQYREFFNEYPNVKPEDVPQEVWQDVNRGVPLTYAYAKHDNRVKSELLAKLQKGANVIKSNAVNQQNSPSALNDTSGKLPAYFTREMVEKMSRKETDKHISQILKDMQTWKE